MGSYAEVVHLPSLNTNMLIDEDGKLRGKSHNSRATALAERLHSGLDLGDYIAGDATITGGPNDNGDTTSLDPLKVHEFTRALQQI